MSRRLNNQFLEEVVEHILANKGPDEDGLAHPNKKVTYRYISAALGRIHRLGKMQNLHPFHFAFISGLWKRRGKATDSAREVTGRWIDYLISEGVYEDLGTLIENVNSKDAINNPLRERVGRRKIQVNVYQMLLCGYSNTVWKAVSDYMGHDLELSETYKGLDREHFAKQRFIWTTKRGKPSSTARSVTGRFIQYLISKGKFVDLNDIIERSTYEDFCGILEENIGGHKFKISYRKVLEQAYKWRKAAAVLDYIKHDQMLRGRYEGLGPEHFGKTGSNGEERLHGGVKGKAKSGLNIYVTKKGKPTKKAREVTGKLIQYLISEKRFKDWNDVIDNIHQDDYRLNPLIEEIGGHNFRVNTNSLLQKAYNNSLSAAILGYIKHDHDLSKKYRGLGPEHFGQAPQNIWTTKDGKPTKKAKEVAGRFIEFLISTRKYKNLNDLIENISGDDFNANIFSEEIAGHEFGINTSSLLQAYNGSCYRATLDYIKRNPKLSRRYTRLGKEHFPKHIQKEWLIDGKPSKLAKDVMKRYFDYLLSLRRYKNLLDFVARIHWKDFRKPLYDKIAGHRFKVSVIGYFEKAYNGSVAEAVLDYVKSTPRLKHYNWLRPIHFVGDPNTRKRRLEGKLSWRDLRIVKKPDGTYDTSAYGLVQFDSAGKELVRNVMVEGALDILADREIRYLGLETEQFHSLRKIAKTLNFVAEGSTVVEKKGRTYRAMVAMQRSSAYSRMLKGIDIRRGEIEKQIHKIEGRYNFVNLDVPGPITERKEETIKNLFERELVEDKSVVYITLSNSKRAKGKAKKRGYGMDQIKTVNEIVQKHSGKYKVIKLFEMPYQGGTNGRPGIPMFTVGYAVSKVA